jgi:hypothetical protein
MVLLRWGRLGIRVALYVPNVDALWLRALFLTNPDFLIALRFDFSCFDDYPHFVSLKFHESENRFSFLKFL